jgi:hypothetical protein
MKRKVMEIREKQERKEKRKERKKEEREKEKKRLRKRMGGQKKRLKIEKMPENEPTSRKKRGMRRYYPSTD